MNVSLFAQEFAKVFEDDACRKEMALWYVDIHGFRSINPKYGYSKGNMVLRMLADSLKEYLCGDLPIARLGGDRFVFVTCGKAFPEAAELLQRAGESLNRAVREAGIKSRITLVGGVYYLRGGDIERRDFKRALDYASIAHRNAQNDSTGALVEFTDEDLERDMRRIIIEQSIDQALDEGQIEVWYQPQVDYVFGEIVGAEALARWNHPDLGWISPGEFIEVLEDCGRIHDLDRYVWEEACKNAGKWRAFADGKPVPISVNVSRTEMLEPGLLEHFQDLKAKYRLPQGSLHLEVTESAFVEERERLQSIVSDMRARGLIVEMDDFGSGLSSLNMLKDVPVDAVKLDMGFVHAGGEKGRGGIVLGSIIRMLQGLDTPIIAEGVETHEQAEMLKSMGCHLMQGFHFARPMPLHEFENFVASNTTVENADRRRRKESGLEQLMEFDKNASFLFNKAIGGTVFFFIDGEITESILVNDKFYEECGLDRMQFGDSRVSPIDEVDESSRASLWRAAAEAREMGGAFCAAQVRLSGRWIDGVMRYLGESTRGDVFSLNIVRSGEAAERSGATRQTMQDFEWNLSMLNNIAPSGFVKCAASGALEIDYVTPHLIRASGLSHDDFLRRFHNSFLKMVVPSDRVSFMEQVRDAAATGSIIECDLKIYRGYNSQVTANVVGRVNEGSNGERALYLALLLKGHIESGEEVEEDLYFDRVIPFDYDIRTDELIIHAKLPDQDVKVIKVEHWLDKLEDLPDNIAPESAAKVLATVNDLRHHPVSGFTDLKCNLRGGLELRWYHVNYSCDSDENGNATVLHGFAHDANDEMGSAKWWRHQAEIDQLTGLLNRSAAKDKIDLAVRSTGGGAMFMIDLDGFKRVNDTLGHLVGDALLRDVAENLKQHFREGDVLGRYGGDEFVAFMPFSPELTGSAQLAERRANEIIATVAEIEIPDGTHVGCSVGIALCRSGRPSFHEILEVADNAMYASKEAGKGRCTLWELETE